ncbi:MAG: ABC transporter permease [Cetobacterium sp.]|uniref:ABC transporter permease n=1 Tax=Cetobacterium sp. TaxID=2071632 RepID=UPI003F3CAD6E
MKFENWMALKFILENKKKIILPFLAIVASTVLIFLSITLKASITKTVEKDLRSMGKNSILIGGDSITSKDIVFINSIPDVDYYLYPDSFKEDEEILFKGYPNELLKKMNLPELRDRDIILDKTQFLNKRIGDRVVFYINGERKEFFLRGFYEELNPLETMKVGKRAILSQSGFDSNVVKYDYKRVLIVFKESADSNDYIPMIISSLNIGRENKIKLLETPDLFKKINKIISFLNKALFLMLALGVGIAGFFTFNITMTSLLEKKSSIGILSAVGMSKSRVFRIFLIQNIYILLSGLFLGVALGYSILKVIELVLNISIYLDGLKVFSVIFTIITLGMLLGVIPIKKIQKLSIIELLKV